MSGGVYRSMYDYLANSGWGTVGTDDDGNTYLAMDLDEHDCRFVVKACYEGVMKSLIKYYDVQSYIEGDTVYPINSLTINGMMGSAYKLVKIYRYLLIDNNWIKMDEWNFSGDGSNVTLNAIGVSEESPTRAGHEADSVIREVETHETLDEIFARWDTLMNEVRNDG